MEFDKYFDFKRKELDEFLIQSIQNDSGYVEGFKEMCLYPIVNGGKRIRPVLTMMVYDSFFSSDVTTNKDMLLLGSALEMIHTYSLVHDDLPAMDDDDMRRGKPTTHVRFGEANAILVGDSLLTTAFGLLSQLEGVDLKTLRALLKELHDASGHKGMVGGQVLDIANENTSLTLEAMENIHHLKTGCMLEASAVLPVIYHQKGDISSVECKAFREYGRLLGLAFQVVDDVLDVTQSTETLGKNANSDVVNNKTTYVTLLGVEGSMSKARQCVEWAKKHIEGLSTVKRKEHLYAMADLVVNRLN